MDKHNGTKRFLQAIFPDWQNRAFFAQANFLKDLWTQTRNLSDLDPANDCYVSCAAFGQGAARRKVDALEVVFLAVDDVGEKVPEGLIELMLGPPTKAVQTSAANQQWFYRLSAPIAVADWDAWIAGVEKLVGVPFDQQSMEAVHVFRLPMGINTKQKPDRGMYPVHEVKSRNNPSVMLDVTSITPVHGKITKPSRDAGGDWSLAHLRALMALVPNIYERKEWVNIGHGLKALCADDADGFTVFDEWSATHVSYDAAATRKAWDSFGAGGLLSQGGRLKGIAESQHPSRFAAIVFDDGVDPPPEPPGSKRVGITATPYKWVDPDKIPPRDWLYGNILIRQFISMTVAPGGVGKSSLIAVEALAQATGQNLLGEKPSGALRVWLWNLEDPGAETTRKLQAAAKHYGIGEADIGGRLFVDSGRDQKLVIAQMDRNGPMIVRPVIGALVEQIRLRKIDVVVIDPFVSCHEVPENDNTAQDMVVKEWGRVAELGHCAVHLVDHTRKGGAEVTTESSRGGKAKTDAARVVRVVNRMSDNQSMTFGVLNPWLYFNTFNDKSNMAPPVDRRDWFFMESVGLGNGGTAAAVFAAGAVGAGVALGDDVGVVRRWVPPSAMDLVTGDNFKAMVAAMGTELWRKDYQAKEKWIGVAAAQALNLDPTLPKDRKAIKDVVSQWFKAGLLKEVSQTDENRKTRKFIKITGGF